MSFEFRACFTVGIVNCAAFGSALETFGLSFVGAGSALVYEADQIKERPGRARDWQAFIDDSTTAVPSAFARFNGDDCFFDLGFVGLPRATVAGAAAVPVRVAWLEISDGNLEKLGYALDDRETNVLHLLVSLFKALRTDSMALGLEVSPSQFMKFFAGSLPQAETDEHIRFAVGVRPSSASAMRANQWTCEVEDVGVTVPRSLSPASRGQRSYLTFHPRVSARVSARSAWSGDGVGIAVPSRPGAIGETCRVTRAPRPRIMRGSARGALR